MLGWRQKPRTKPWTDDELRLFASRLGTYVSLVAGSIGVLVLIFVDH